MPTVAPAVGGIDPFKKGKVVITVEQPPNKALELTAKNGSFYN
jgi:hypothetical protein